MLLVVGLGVWEGLNQSPLMGGGAELSEYEQLLAGADESAKVPPPSEIAVKAWQGSLTPFAMQVPTTKALALGYSLYHVLSGYLLAALVAIPIGFLIGCRRWRTGAQPVHSGVAAHLAGLDAGAVHHSRPEASAIFVIFICSIWPMLLNGLWRGRRTLRLGERGPPTSFHRCKRPSR